MIGKRKIKSLFQETLLRNSFYLILSTGTMAVFGFVFWLIVAHLFRPDQLGLASALISSMSFIAYLSLLGFNYTFIRFLPRSKYRDKQINTGLVAVTIAAIVGSGLFVLVAPDLVPKFSLLHHHLLFGLGFIGLCLAASINLVTDSIFVAYRSAGYNFVIDGLLASSLQLLLPIALISLGGYGIYAAQGGGAFLAMVLSLVFLVRKFNYRPEFKLSRTVLRQVAHYSSFNYVGNLLTIVPTIALPLIILNKLGAPQAAYYYLAFMMANLLFAIAYAVAQSMFAEGSYNEDRLWPIVRRSAVFLAALIVPASLLLAGLGPIVLNIFGKTYGQHSGQVIPILAAAGPFMGACALGTVILRITKHVNQIVLINLIYALVICGLAAVWAHHGLNWIALAWLIGQAVTAVAIFAAIGWGHYRHRASAHKPA